MSALMMYLNLFVVIVQVMSLIKDLIIKPFNIPVHSTHKIKNSAFATKVRLVIECSARRPRSNLPALIN